MGGTIIETESERLIRQGISQGMERGIVQGEAKMLIEMGQEYGLDETAILKRLQDKLGISLEQSILYLEQYKN